MVQSKVQNTDDFFKLLYFKTLDNSNNSTTKKASTYRLGGWLVALNTE